jgi:hypothetical protein
LVSTGTPGNTIWELIGFSGADRTGSNIYTGNLQSTMKVYRPQFKLQDFISPEHFKKAIDPTTKKTADGKIEVVRFGTERFIQMNMRMITNKPMDGKVIRNNPTGVEDTIEFMDFATTKAEFEFMPDAADPDTFLTVILDKTPEAPDGTGYKLDELYERNLPDFFETGRLMMRVVE